MVNRNRLLDIQYANEENIQMCFLHFLSCSQLFNSHHNFCNNFQLQICKSALYISTHSVSYQMMVGQVFCGTLHDSFLSHCHPDNAGAVDKWHFWGGGGVAGDGEGVGCQQEHSNPLHGGLKCVKVGFRLLQIELVFTVVTTASVSLSPLEENLQRTWATILAQNNILFI